MKHRQIFSSRKNRFNPITLASTVNRPTRRPLFFFWTALLLTSSFQSSTLEASGPPSLTNVSALPTPPSAATTTYPWSSGGYYRFGSQDSVSSSAFNTNFETLYYYLNAVLNTGILGSAPLSSTSFTTASSGGGIFLAPGGFGSISLTSGSNAGISLTANGTGSITLTPGTSGNTVLNGNVGIGTTSPGSALQVNGPIATANRSVSTAGTFNVLATDSVVLINAAAGNITANLPTLPGNPSIAGRTYTLKRTDSVSYTITSSADSTPSTTVAIQPASGTIEGQSAIYLPSQYSYIQVTNDGSNWYLTSAWSPPLILIYNTGGSSSSTQVYCPQGMRPTGGGCTCEGTSTMPYQGFFVNVGEGNDIQAGATTTKSGYQCNSTGSNCAYNAAQVACTFSPF